MTTRSKVRPSLWALVVGALLMAVIASGAPAARAAVQPAGTTIRNAQTFYVYTKGAGESVRVDFRYDSDSPAGGALVPSQVRITSPAGVVTTCLAVEALPCLRVLSSPTAGVWTIEFQPATPFERRLYSWSIGVTNLLGTVTYPGRTWTDRYVMFQWSTAGQSFSFWYLGRTGEIYRADYRQFMGVDSAFQANQFGNAVGPPPSCTSAYRSIATSAPPAYYTTGAACGPMYHLFFEAPDPTLPASATLPNGTSTFVNPAVVKPSVSPLTFTPLLTSGGTTVNDSRRGTFGFDVTNFIGTATLAIDTNNNGVYTDPVDVTIPFTSSDVATTSRSIAWDGRDGLGNPVAGDQPIRARVAIDRTGEIHFVNTDVEVRGSIAVQALRGTNAGGPNQWNLSWDDSRLGSSAQRVCLTNQVTGTNVNSSGGVHGWGPGVSPVTAANPCPTGPIGAWNVNDDVHGSWGDVRAIDDWTSQAASAYAELAIGAYDVEKVSDAVTPVKPGDVVTYTITAAQVGTDPGRTIPVAPAGDPANTYRWVPTPEGILVDDLTGVLDDADYVAGSLTTTWAPPTPTSGTPVIDVPARRLEWTGSLATGQTLTITYRVRVKGAAALGGTDFSLRNTVRSPGCTTRCSTQDDVGYYLVSKTADPVPGSTVSAGTVVTYAVTVTRKGIGPVANPSFADDLSDVLDDATFVADATSPVAQTTSGTGPAGTATFDAPARRLTWSVPSFTSPDQVITVRYKVRVTGAGSLRLHNVVTPTNPAGSCDPAPGKVCETTHVIPPGATTIELRKDLPGDTPGGRAAGGDQFRLSVTGAGIGTGNVVTTTGSAGGLQPDRVGPLVAQSGQTYAVAEQAANGTDLGSYTSTWRCIDTKDGDAVVASGSGSSGSVTVPAASVRGAAIVCTITNIPRPLDVPGLQLPFTGGIGTWAFGVGALVLLGSAVAVLRPRLRRTGYQGARVRR